MQAWNLLQQLQPELLVLDVELPRLDGITLLQRMYAAGYHPAVVVVSRMLSDYAMETLLQMGIDYFVRKPCQARDVAIRAEDILRYHRRHSLPQEEDITAMLKELGIPMHLHGAKYLPLAITMTAKNPTQYITKELYPAVGKQFGVSGESVERCIRNAVQQGWNSGNHAAWAQYFSEKTGSTKQPNNGMFIARMVEILKIRMGK